MPAVWVTSGTRCMKTDTDLADQGIIAKLNTMTRSMFEYFMITQFLRDAKADKNHFSLVLLPKVLIVTFWAIASKWAITQ